MPFAVTPNMAWLLLLVAGLLEIVWAISMKASDGFTRHHYTAITVVAAWLSFWLLGLSLKHLPVGTAYAVWVGIGAAGTAIVGAFLLGESLGFARGVCVALIVAGVLGIKFLSGDGAA